MAGDVLDRASLAPALSGVDTAYYLVHSMAAADFEQADRAAAQNFAAAAKEAGVRKIIYLGGLGEGGGLSPICAAVRRSEKFYDPPEYASSSSVLPSLSVRVACLLKWCVRLVERLPVMITPKWVSVPAQPFAIGDLLQYLVLASAIAGAWRVEFLKLAARIAFPTPISCTSMPVNVACAG